MKLRHKKPCQECPWRLKAPAGWLGGHEPEFYADAVAGNEIPACHLQDFGPDDPRSSFCAGALATAANACIRPTVQEGAAEARLEVGRRDDVFAHPARFFEHHSGGQPYVHPILRRRAG